MSPPPSRFERGVAERGRDADELSVEELEAQSGEELPDREALSLLDANVAIPVNAAVAANVLSDSAAADAEAEQTAEVDQPSGGG
ncbi:MAG: hypothetical protein ACR2NV_09190 [Thermoleophilaceae bacterium]|jgi:hypothetical protein